MGEAMANDQTGTTDTKNGHEGGPAPATDETSSDTDDPTGHVEVAPARGKHGPSSGQKPRGTTWLTWSGFSEGIKVGAAVATIFGACSLYFLWEQMTQNAHGQIYQQMVEIDKFFVENPKVRLYIYKCSRPEDLFAFASPEELLVETSRAEATAEMMLDFMSQVALTLPHMGDERVNWEKYLKGLYKGSLVLQAYYTANESLYSNEDISDIINIARDELMQGDNPCQRIETPTP